MSEAQYQQYQTYLENNKFENVSMQDSEEELDEPTER